MTSKRWWLCSFVAAAGVSPLQAAIVNGAIDTFEDGAFQGWNGAADANVPSGGPAGTDDNYLHAASGSFGLTPHLAIENQAPPNLKWGGNYTAAGVTRIEADMNLLAVDPPANLQMRVVLFGGTSGSSRVTSTAPVLLPADGQWHHLTFDLTTSSLTLVLGADSIANVLQNVNRVMLRHQTGLPGSTGTPVSAQVGFDNIAATPEPASALLLTGSVACMLLSRRRRAIRTLGV